MNKTRIKYTKLFLIVISLFTIQWATTHVHPSQPYNHANISHQHQIQIHSHQFITKTNFSHENSHSNIIEFDDEYTLQENKKLKKLTTDIGIIDSYEMTFIPLRKIKIPSNTNTHGRHVVRSYSNPRAPPLNS